MCLQSARSDEARSSKEHEDMLIDDGENNDNGSQEQTGHADSTGEDDKMIDADANKNDGAAECKGEVDSADEDGDIIDADANDEESDSSHDNFCHWRSPERLKSWIASSIAASPFARPASHK